MLEQYNINTNVEGELGDFGPPALPTGDYKLRLLKFTERQTQSRDVYVDLDFGVIECATNPQLKGALHRESVRVFSSEGKQNIHADKFFKAVVKALGFPAGTKPSDNHLRKLSEVTLDCYVKQQPGGTSKTTGKEYSARSQIEKMAPAGAPAATAPPAAPAMPGFGYGGAPVQQAQAPVQQQFAPPPMPMQQQQLQAPPPGYSNAPPAAYQPPMQAPMQQQAPQGGLPSWMNPAGQ